MQSVILQACMTGRQTFPFVAACKQSSETDGAKTTYFSTLWCLSQAPKMEIYSELHTYEISICHGGFCRTICSVVGSACLHKPVKARKCSCEFSKGQGRNKLFPSVTAEKLRCHKLSLLLRFAFGFLLVVSLIPVAWLQWFHTSAYKCRVCVLGRRFVQLWLSGTSAATPGN